MDLINTNNLILIPVLTGIGFSIKHSKTINDSLIPLLLILIGGVLGWFSSPSFEGLLQGFLCATVTMGLYDTQKLTRRACKHGRQ